MKIIEAPNDYADIDESPNVFLAGGISFCQDWQSEAIKKLKNLDRGVILNPRSKHFDVTDKAASEKQIEWEFYAIQRAEVFSIWFCDSYSDQPICMFELGAAISTFYDFYTFGTERYYTLIVGVEPGYNRELDVHKQLSMHTPNIKISTSLDEHISKIEDIVKAPIWDR